MSYVRSAAGIGLGSVLSCATTAAPTVFTAVAELRTLTLSSRTALQADVTNFASLTKETVGVIIDEGSWDFTGTRIGGDAGQTAMETNFYLLAPVPMKVQIPPNQNQSTGDLFAMLCTVTELSYGISAEKEVTITGKLKVSGKITTTLGTALV